MIELRLLAIAAPTPHCQLTAFAGLPVEAAIGAIESSASLSAVTERTLRLVPAAVGLAGQRSEVVSRCSRLQLQTQQGCLTSGRGQRPRQVLPVMILLNPAEDI